MKQQGITAADVRDELTEKGISQSQQVEDLLAKGFELEELIVAGYTERNIKQGSDVSDAVYAAAASEVNGPEPTSGSSTVTIVVVVAVVVIAAVLAFAYVTVSRKNKSGDEVGTAAFENPMYSSYSANEPSQSYSNGGGGGGAAGYMDVPAPATNAGYMDVAPTSGGEQTSSVGYMDVAPTSGGGETFDGGFGSSDEEV